MDEYLEPKDRPKEEKSLAGVDDVVGSPPRASAKFEPNKLKDVASAPLGVPKVPPSFAHEGRKPPF